MKRIFFVAAVLFSTAAHADQMVYKYYDTIRPHGHKRSDAIGEANINFCNERAGIQYGAVSSAYKKCMRVLGYRYLSSHLERTPEPLPEAESDYTPTPALETHTPDSNLSELPPDATVTIPTFDQNTGAPLPP